MKMSWFSILFILYGVRILLNNFHICHHIAISFFHGSSKTGVGGHYGNQSRGYLMRGGPLWPPAVPRLAARHCQSNPRGSGPKVLKRERGHVTSESEFADVGVFRALQPNILKLRSLISPLQKFSQQYMLDSLNHIIISHVPPQLSCGETCGEI